MPEISDFSLLHPGSHSSLLWVLIVIFIALCVWAIVKIMEATRKAPQTSQEKLINQLGRVIAPISSTKPGKVHVFGEIWDALSADPAEHGPIVPKTEVRVVGMDTVNPKRLRVTRFVQDDELKS